MDAIFRYHRKGEAGLIHTTYGGAWKTLCGRDSTAMHKTHPIGPECQRCLNAAITIMFEDKDHLNTTAHLTVV
jgi:bacterioferritin-associated ferredoxin